jgi:hypothetical protein
MDYAALLQLLPEPYRSFVYVVLQLIAVFTLAVPAIEKLVKLTKTDKDDRALSSVQKFLSLFPRVQIPAVSQRPPAPVLKIDATKWPTPDKLGGATVPLVEASKSTVIVPPADPK